MLQLATQYRRTLMQKSNEHTEARRAFLKFITGSPLITGLALHGALANSLLASDKITNQSTRQFAGLGNALITSPEEAINIFDFEAVAQQELPPAHWGYLATGTDGDITLRANREGFEQFQLRMRRLIDVRDIDMSKEIFGTTWPTPIVIAPCGHQMAFHTEGELPVARAARTKNHLQILSTVSNTSVEDVTEARGAPIWYQLYATKSWEITEALVKRAEAAGCPAVAITVDLQGGSNRETIKKFAKLDKRECTNCHLPPDNAVAFNPMYDGLSVPAESSYGLSLTWDFVRKVQDLTTMKVLIKGIVTAEDARLAVEHGIDGIIVSNHGGRAEASGRSTIECLPEIVEAVQGQIPILIDSGFRRGTDFFKALAIGADAVCVGRPYLWGLASFGQAGVEAVLTLLRAELELVMRQTGVTSLNQITRAHIAKRLG